MDSDFTRGYALREGAMKNSIKLMFSILVALHVSASAAPQKKAKIDEKAVIEKIEAKLASNPVVEPFGFKVSNIYALEEDLQAIASNKLGLDRRLQIVEIREDSIAAKAGLKKGDHLVDIGGKHIPRDEEAFHTMVNDILPQIDLSKPTQIIVLRNGLGTILSLPAILH
ncbi:hypothetical protein MLD52_12055 [Puniceicoccaceae bacterium K14]|nr:hypothetical protein [Puniceicoccaceae bacterium K14]